MSPSKRNKVFLGVWAACGLLIFISHFMVQDHSSFVGVVGSRAQEITTNAAAKVKKIHVISGQIVRAGDLLIELENPQMELEISKIQAELGYLRDQKALLSGLVDTEGVEDSRLENLEKQLAILNEEKKALFVFSQFDGKVETITKREGENVQAHLPIMTLQELTPTTIRGYIHESILDEVKIGSIVGITSLSGTSEDGVYGKVLSFGSSIIPFPERLLKDPARPMWGREVLIEIPSRNPLILGEKVFITKMSKAKSLFNRAYAGDKNRKASPDDAFLEERRRLELKVAGKRKFEASGIVFLRDIQKYLTVSDGKNSEETPQVLVLDKSGETVFSTHVKGLDHVNDLESAATDADGNIYLLSSLTVEHKKNKKGRTSKSMVMLRREGMEFSKAAEVPLHDVIKRIILRNPRSELAQAVMEGGELHVDVEGMAVDGANLYLGLRQPLKGTNEAILLRMDNFRTLFTDPGVPKDLVVAELLDLRAQDGERLGISDLSICGGVMYVAGAPADKDGRKGAIFRMKLGAGKSSLVKIHDYADEKPEGVHCHPESRDLVVTFDHGDQGSHLISYDVRR